MYEPRVAVSALDCIAVDQQYSTVPYLLVSSWTILNYWEGEVYRAQARPLLGWTAQNCLVQSSLASKDYNQVVRAHFVPRSLTRFVVGVVQDKTNLVVQSNIVYHGMNSRIVHHRIISTRLIFLYYLSQWWSHFKQLIISRWFLMMFWNFMQYMMNMHGIPYASFKCLLFF